MRNCRRRLGTDWRHIGIQRPDDSAGDLVPPIRLGLARAAADERRVGSIGSIGALRAVGLISFVLFLVNVVEAAIPGFVPVWMRIEMVGIAGLMAVVLGLVIRERV